MDNKKYNVTTLKTPASEQVTEKLAKLFKISTQKATQIIQKESFIIKKETDKATAEKFYKAITAAGVLCRIDELPGEEDSALPDIEEVTVTDEGKPLTDITRPDIKPLDEEPVQMDLEAMPVEKPAGAKKEKAIKDIDPANYCPECGTIRASAESVCIHCDYDPLAVESSNKKSLFIKLAIVLLVLLIAAGVAYPFYQQYARQGELEEDLFLAFDTRNAVTEFIQVTNFWPNQNIDAGLDKKISNRSIKSVTVGENSIITIVIRGQVLDGSEQTLIFVPKILKGRIVWNCLQGTLDEKFRPEVCREHIIE